MFESYEGTPPCIVPLRCLRQIDTWATLRGKTVTFVTQVKEWRNQAKNGIYSLTVGVPPLHLVMAMA